MDRTKFLPALRRLLIFSVVAGLFFAGAAGAKPPSNAGGADLDRIVRLWAAATGGLERLRALRSVRMTGRITVGSDPPHPITVEIARPGKIRTEVRFPEGAWVQVFDGSRGWTISPSPTHREALPMTPEQAASAPEQADIDGPLVDSARKGIRLALEGKTTVGGKEAWRIRVTRPDGVVRYLDIDGTTSLKVRWLGELGEGSNRQMNASVFLDYRSVGGLSFPFRIVSGIAGGAVNQEIDFDRIEVNPTIPESDFSRPR